MICAIVLTIAILLNLVWLHKAGNECFSPYEKEFLTRRPRTKMANVYTKILHSVTYREDGKTIKSDKVFIIEVNDIDKKFLVTATWGKRMALRLSSLVLEECQWEMQAVAKADKYVRAKKENKDKYIEAPASLVIPGFKKHVISAIETRTDSIINEPKVTISSQEPPSRKIRV